MLELKISNFAAISYSNGQMYIYRTTVEPTKNHQDENTASGEFTLETISTRD